MMPERAPDAAEPPAAPPYKFLNYFEEPDSASFAGRDDEVQEALAGLTRGKTYVLYGRSGLGKTSLLLAGLFPRLRERGYHPLRVRLLESPVEDFCAALAGELHCPELAEPMPRGERQQRVPHVLEVLSAREPLVIVLDQFEEFFVRFRDRPEERAEFEALLGHIHQDHAANIRFVFSLREDYYAELGDLREELPDLTDHGLRLQPLTAYGTRQAIVRPLQQAHVTYEEAFVNRLVDLLADWAFAPPVLQIVCTELYRDVVARRGLPVHLTREDLERLGGVDGIFRGYVHRVTSGLASERMLLVRVVLHSLISSERTRYALRAEDLLKGPIRAEYGEIRAVLDHLTEQGLLRVEHRKDERWYELLHEHLMSIVESWLSSDVDFVRFRTTRDFVTSLTEDPRWRATPEWLITAPQLEERVEPWKEWLRLDEDPVEFLLRSSIHGQAGSVAYWAARYDEFGAGRAERLVLELLSHADPLVRRGAAAACGQLPDAAGRFSSRSLELALTDPDGDVRRAAGRSFLGLARPEELARMRGALEVPAQRALAMELLADRLEAGRSLDGVPEHWVRLAKSLVRARRLERETLTIRARTLTGAQVGSVSALVWGFSIGLVVVAYWIWTIYPEQLSARWPRFLLNQMFWLIIDNIPFAVAPWGLILGWRLARRMARTAAATGREHWLFPVRQSGTLIISCVLFHLVVLMTFPINLEEQAALARLWNVRRSAIFLTVLLASAIVEWLLTMGTVWLGGRCIRPHSRLSVVFLFAALSSTALPIIAGELLTMGVGWAAPRPEALYVVINRTLVGAVFVVNFQSFIVMCVLAAERSRRAAAPWRETYSARVAVLLATLVFTALILISREPRTLPGMSARQQLGRVMPLEGKISHYIWDVEYFFLGTWPGEPFALSIDDVQSSATRLIINGQELTDGMLLVSPWSQLTAAVASRPGSDPPGAQEPDRRLRTSYHYLLRREPIRVENPGELDARHWVLVQLPLEQVQGRERQPPLWQVTLKGRLLPPQLEAAHRVHVHPVLANIAELNPGACLGISISSGGDERHMDTFVLTNRADSGHVPRPDSETERFVEGIQLRPAEDGSWSTTLHLTPIVEFRPQKCEPRLDAPAAIEIWEPTVPDLYGPRPTLLVAIKLY